MPIEIRPRDGLSVGRLMQRRPETIGVFLRRGMYCVGCSVNLMHTLDEVCVIYRLDPDVLRNDLRAAIREIGRSPKTPQACGGPSPL
jgi:hybrid cluster-associated redox disulfide protein